MPLVEARRPPAASTKAHANADKQVTSSMPEA
jgi:hypothetical protein